MGLERGIWLGSNVSKSIYTRAKIDLHQRCFLFVRWINDPHRRSECYSAGRCVYACEDRHRCSALSPILANSYICAWLCPFPPGWVPDCSQRPTLTAYSSIYALCFAMHATPCPLAPPGSARFASGRTRGLEMSMTGQVRGRPEHCARQYQGSFDLQTPQGREEMDGGWSL
jgi:hypothetical protein